MPSKPLRTSFTPSRDFATRKIPVTVQVPRAWFRIHWSEFKATEFGLENHHRFSHLESDCNILYLGPNLSTCLWEVFGDDVYQGRRTIALSRWEGRSVSRIDTPRLKVCALSRERTRTAMNVDKAALLSTDLRVPQQWALAIQRHPNEFDALQYTSRFVDQPCLALFDRPGFQRNLKVTELGALTDLDESVDWLHAQSAALV